MGLPVGNLVLVCLQPSIYILDTWLYANPTMRVYTNYTASPRFLLTRDTRQKCPLSPKILTLDMEPLVILISGLSVGQWEERISLYVDHVLLYLGIATTSLLSALEIGNTFGSFSGIKITWNKSFLFPLDRR